eukprot:scaffold157673_cov60-Attheya_sp.AAC.1
MKTDPQAEGRRKKIALPIREEMCAALNCPAWRLQNSLVAPRRLGDDEYTAMVRGLVYLH